MKILLTSGGTKVPIDSVRHIGNMSRGTFGSNLASRMLANDWQVDFVYAEGSRAPHKMEIDVHSNLDAIASQMFTKRDIIGIGRYHAYAYKDFAEYQLILNYKIDTFKPDVIVLAAAVSDYGTVPVDGKIRSKDNLKIDLEPLPKIISGIKDRAPDALLVGFKLLVDSTDEELVDAAYDSILKNRCDLVVANDLRDIKQGNHTVWLVTKDGAEVYKDDPAGEVVRAIHLMMEERK